MTTNDERQLPNYEGGDRCVAEDNGYGRDAQSFCFKASRSRELSRQFGQMYLSLNKYLVKLATVS